eukprot:1415190-Amphidinium_carterae.3
MQAFLFGSKQLRWTACLCTPPHSSAPGWPGREVGHPLAAALRAEQTARAPLAASVGTVALLRPLQAVGLRCGLVGLSQLCRVRRCGGTLAVYCSKGWCL